MYKGTPKSLTAKFSSETIEVRKELNEIVKVIKEKILKNKKETDSSNTINQLDPISIHSAQQQQNSCSSRVYTEQSLGSAIC